MNWRNEIFICDRRGNVFRIDFAKGESTLIIRYGNAISHMATNPLQPGELLISSLQTNKLSLYNTNALTSANLLSTLQRVHNKKIEYFEFHPMSRLCLSVSEDSVVLWDTLKLKTVKILTCPNSTEKKPQRFQHACFHNGDLLTCINDCVYIWDLHTYESKNSLELPPNSASRHLDIKTFSVSPDGTWLLSGGQKHNYVAVWNYQDRTLHRVIALPYGTNGVQKFIFSPDSERCIILTKEGKIICMRLNDFFILFELHAVTSFYLNVSLSADWKLLEVHTDEGLVQIYDVPTVQQHQQKLRQIQSYAATLDQDPTLSDSQKYMPSVDVSRAGVRDAHTSSSVNRRQVQSNTIVSEPEFPTPEETYTLNDNSSSTPQQPQSQFQFSSPPQNNGSRNSALAESKRAAFKKSVPRRIRTTKWTERNAPITANFNDREVPPKQVQLPKSNAKEMALNFEKLRRLLLTHGEYPEKYRTLVWRFVVSLPENNDVFSNLLMKGPHLSTEGLHKRFPITDGRLFRRLCKVLSALAHYSPIFACSDSVPELAFPFLKVYGSDFVSIFETVVTFYRNWGREWLDVVPNAPTGVLDMVEHILEENDPGLLDHFRSHKISAEGYAWTPLKAVFSHNFSKQQWSKLMDHVLTMPPIFLYYFAVAYLSYFRRTLLTMESDEDFNFFFQHESPCDINKIIQKAYDLLQRTELKFPNYKRFEKLPASFYPVMSKFPTQIVRPQLSSRDRILKEEKKLLQRKQRFVEEEKSRLQTGDESMSQMRLNAALKEADDRLQQDMREREEELVKRRTDLINRRLQEKGKADLVESDKAEFSTMNEDVRQLRASQSEMMKCIERANAEIAQLKYERILSDLQKEKVEIQDALSRQGQENSLLREALEEKERQIASLQQEKPQEKPVLQSSQQENLADSQPPSQRDAEEPIVEAEERQRTPLKEEPLDRSAHEAIRVDTLETTGDSEQRALKKTQMPSQADKKTTGSRSRPSDPVGKQLESGVISPPPKPLGAAPVPLQRTRRTPRRDIDTRRQAKKRPSSSHTAPPQTKNRKVVIPKPARSATPSSTSDTPASPPSKGKRNESQSTRSAVQTPAPQLATKQKGQLSEEQNRYIREKFMDFIHSRTTIEGESPGKNASSSGTDYPWMEELSDSISISDSYSLGEVSKDEDSILQTLQERRPAVTFDELNYLHDEDTTEDLSYLDDDDMITTLPSTTLGDFSAPSGLRTDSTLSAQRSSVHLASSPNKSAASTSTAPTLTLNTHTTTSTSSTPTAEMIDPLDYSSSYMSTTGITTTPSASSGAEHPSKWVSSSSNSTSASASLTSTPDSKGTTRRKRLVYSSPSISFTSNPRTSDYLDSESESDDAVPLKYRTESSSMSDADVSTATTDILQTSTSS